MAAGKQGVVKSEVALLNLEKHLEYKEYKLNAEALVPKAKQPDSWFLMFTVLSGVLLLTAGGCFIVWTSPALVAFQSTDPLINPMGRPITTLETSQLAGIPTFAAIVGTLFLSPLSDKIGRKLSLQLAGLGMFFNIVIIAFSRNISLTITCLSLNGCFFAAIWVVLPVYITEICQDHNRAKYGCIISGAVPMGQLFLYCIGHSFPLRIFTLLITIPLVLSEICFLVAPESPVFLLFRGKRNECICVLKKLRNNIGVDHELSQITYSLSEIAKKKKSNILTVFKSTEGRVGFFLATLPIYAQYFSGASVLMPMMAPIFNAAGTSLSGNTAAVIAGFCKVSCFMFTSLIIEKTGRKFLLLLSSTLSSIPMLLLGTFFFLKHIGSPIIVYLQWIPLVSILSYIIFFSIGLGPIPSAIMSEYFPSDIRSSLLHLLSLVQVQLYLCIFLRFRLLQKTLECTGVCGCLVFYLYCLQFVCIFSAQRLRE